MVIQTESPALTRSRRTILEMLLSSYYDAGYEASNMDTEFEHWVKHYGIDPGAVTMQQPRYPIDQDPNPFVWVDFNKCILCNRCIRACAEVQGRFVWDRPKGVTTPTSLPGPIPI
jgi:formate dehydrogenase major subunit/formate dehydrogenase alpha subunit